MPCLNISLIHFYQKTRLVSCKTYFLSFCRSEKDYKIYRQIADSKQRLKNQVIKNKFCIFALYFDFQCNGSTDTFDVSSRGSNPLKSTKIGSNPMGDTRRLGDGRD